jgi:RimJ/RimL family protein N-acetyltransferase
MRCRRWHEHTQSKTMSASEDQPLARGSRASSPSVDWHDGGVTELVTERLELRRWRETDLDSYARIAADPEVGRFVGGPFDRATAWRQIAIFIGHRELRGWTQSAVVERSSGRLVGRGGLWQPEGWPGTEVGWVLDRNAWGQGYATELGRAVRDLAFKVLHIPHLISVIERDNVASIRVAERIGATFESEYDLNGTRCVIYGQRAPRRDTGRNAAAPFTESTPGRVHHE